VLITKEVLERRLAADERWHQVSPNVWRWFGGDPNYEIQYRSRLDRNWHPATGPNQGVGTHCRIRKVEQK
jgi:hypothetical protein